MEIINLKFKKANSFLLRSQLDCQDPRLPKKSFDLKTRATLPIRMDVANYRVNTRILSSHLTPFVWFRIIWIIDCTDCTVCMNPLNGNTLTCVARPSSSTTFKSASATWTASSSPTITPPNSSVSNTSLAQRWMKSCLVIR